MMKNSFNLQDARGKLKPEEEKYELSELFYRHLPGPDAEVLYGIEYHKEMDPADAQLDVKDLLAPGYCKRENGYCNLPNGGAYVAVRTTFMGIEPEMYNYWRKWRHDCSAEEADLRFKLWCPGSHDYLFSIPSGDGGKDIPAGFTEDLGYGNETLTTEIQVKPETLYEKEEFEQSPMVSIHGGGGICGERLPYVGLHHIRMIEGGFEIRSRFWFGYTLEDGKLKFAKPEDLQLDPEFVYAYAHHVANEMANLRTLLPAVWATKK